MANKEREDLKNREDYGRGQQRRDEPETERGGQTGKRPGEPGRSDEPGRQGQGGGSESYPDQPGAGRKRPETDSDELEEESR